MAEAGKPIGGQKHAQDPGSDRHACDLLIRNGRILTLDADRRIVPVGAIAIAGHRIAGIGAESEIVRRFHARRVLDAAGAQVHPGFIDGHFHVNQHSARGFNRLLATRTNGRVNFADWKAALQDDDEYASSALACLDLLQHGYTGFVDGGTAFSPDAVADAARATGIRGWARRPDSGTVGSSWTTCRASSVDPWRIEPRSIPIAPCDGLALSCAGTPIRTRSFAGTWRCTGSGQRRTSSCGPPRIVRIAIAWL